MVEVGELVVIAVGIAWVLTQLFTILAARWTIEQARQESMLQKDEVVAHFDEQLQSLKTHLETVQIDARPLMDQVQAELIPAVQERVDHVKAVIQGKLGIVSRGMKQLGEGVLERVGEEALEEGAIDVEEYMQQQLARIGIDPEWARQHPYAAIGLEYLRRQLLPEEGVKIGNPSKGRTATASLPKGFK